MISRWRCWLAKNGRSGGLGFRRRCRACLGHCGCVSRGATMFDAGVSTVGGSNIMKVPDCSGSFMILVHIADQVGSRVKASVGGLISGRNGDPTVGTKVPSADVLMPTPQVGQAKSLITSGFMTPSKSTLISLKSEMACPVGKCDVSPLIGAHVRSWLGAKVITGLVTTGPRLVH